jgi:metal-responsive CopG/Arc/MetJ family transcriptional regulator
MPNIKTAISLQKSLFEQVDLMSREMKVSRSRLFVMALEDYIRRYQNQVLLDKINQTYPKAPEKIEKARLRGMKKGHQKAVEGEW